MTPDRQLAWPKKKVIAAQGGPVGGSEVLGPAHQSLLNRKFHHSYHYAPCR